MNTIQKLHAREILDSRGNPTIELEMILDSGMKSWSSVPSGASTGIHEAHELRDGEKRMNGKGVRNAIKNIHDIIAPAIIGMNPINQSEIDNKMLELDGTANKSKLGANAILAVSMCVARLGAYCQGKKLYQHIAELSGQNPKMPRPFFNVINGGMHAGNSLPFQEFMISPRMDNFADTYYAAAEIYAQLKKNLKTKFGGAATLLGDEGGFAPDHIEDTYEVLDMLMTAVADAGYAGQVDFALDLAASEFYRDGNYDLGFKTETSDMKSVDEMIALYVDICEKYPIISVEDPFDQDDFSAFAQLRKILAEKNIQVVGDDLTVTSPVRIQTAIEDKSCNSLLLKINQIGSISEAIAAFKLARSENWTVMVSHRSGETTDDFIADFAVGVGAEQVKFGSVARGERVVKYNRLLAISEEL
ncbi:MAG: phosphopyruvate hydratase [Candidatus Pacebacteria bacterium]|nr:phosphopyruvate hydratase [Candidatus Paceibacterota bacterium]